MYTIRYITDTDDTDGGEGLIAVTFHREHSPPPYSVPPIFPTRSDAEMQVGYMRHPKGHVIPAHYHPPRRRTILRTSEVLFVVEGTIQAALYNTRGTLLTALHFFPGDLVLLCGGGHEITMVEDSIIVEVKQGPYLGEDDKVHYPHTHPILNLGTSRQDQPHHPSGPHNFGQDKSGQS